MHVEWMLAEILKTNPLDHLGIHVTLTHLSFTAEKLVFAGTVVSEHQLSPPGLSLVLSSDTSRWSFRSVFKEDRLVFEGDIPTKTLSRDVSLTILFNNIQCLWMEMRLDVMLILMLINGRVTFRAIKISARFKSWTSGKENIRFC